ncbi:MAG: hypothetical protein NT169_11935 [Chloroflexi bacterium]|nr:hypothetical protein [Chloroflexota bacterium]
MKLRNQSFAWAAFLFLAGVFLLLKNLAVFGIWGEAAWGGLFALAGLGFLVWFVFDSGRWWRAIPGFTLASIGAEILLSWQHVNLGDWRGALVMFGLALGFWTVLIVHRDNWWAVMPGGILTLLGVLNGVNGLQGRLSQEGWLALFFLGLGLVFALLYLVRFGQEDTHWAGVPAAALLLLGVVTLFGAFAVPAIIAQWWPLLLIVAGVGLALGSLTRTHPPATPTVAPVEDFAAIPPAAGTSVVATLPEAGSLPEKAAPPAIAATLPEAPKTSATLAKEDAPADIYALLKQQPGDGDKVTK